MIDLRDSKGGRASMHSSGRDWPSITLHVGAHRTGSTLLQAMLDEQRASLNENGVDALTPPRIGKRDEATLRAIYRVYSNRIEKSYRSNLTGRFKRSRLVASARQDLLALSSANCDRLILSDENFLGPIVDPNATRGCYPHAEDRALRLSMLAGRRTERIFLACRPYDALSFSAFLMTRIYGGSKAKTRDFKVYKEAALSDEMGWIRIVSAIRESFPDPEIVVWVHEDFDPVKRFEQLTSLPVAAFEPGDLSSVENAAPTQSAFDAYRILSAKRSLSKKERDQLVLQHANGPRIELESVFLPAERSRLQERYREQLNSIAAMPNVRLA